MALQVSGSHLEVAARGPLQLCVWPELGVQDQLQTALMSHDCGGKRGVDEDKLYNVVVEFDFDRIRL